MEGRRPELPLFGGFHRGAGEGLKGSNGRNPLDLPARVQLNPNHHSAHGRRIYWISRVSGCYDPGRDVTRYDVRGNVPLLL